VGAKCAVRLADSPQEAILPPTVRDRRPFGRLSQVRPVAADDVEILRRRPEDHGMWPVLPLPLESSQQLDVVEPVVAVGIANPIESGTVRVRNEVKAVERE